jgi:PBP1b-binding outer membrane lipoprotein LpoB
VRIKLLTLIISIIVFVGCSSKKEQDLLKSYSKNIEYHKNLQQTETAELIVDGQRVAMLTATYMFRPTLDKNDTRDEEFIIAVQFEEENSTMNFNKIFVSAVSTSSDTNTSHKTNEYSLTLNSAKAIKVKKIQHGDTRLKTLSFVTGWSEYYHITFKHTKSTRVNLKFSSKYANDMLNFSKIAKFVYTKKGF